MPTVCRKLVCVCVCVRASVCVCVCVCVCVGYDESTDKHAADDGVCLRPESKAVHISHSPGHEVTFVTICLCVCVCKANDV